MASSIVVKVPTFISIYKAGTMDGFAKGALFGECVLYSNAAFYGVLMGYDFSAWGETGFQLVQAWLMVILYFRYSNPKDLRATDVLIPLACYGAYLSIVFGALEREQYGYLPKANWPMVILTRGIQIKVSKREF